MNDERPQYVEVRAGGVHWRVSAQCRDWLVGPAGLRLEEWLCAGQAHVVKQGPHRTVYRIALPRLSFYLKHYPLHDLRSWLRQLFRPAKARSEFDRALAVAARQVPTVVPLALGERPGGESFLITRNLEGTQTLGQFIEATLLRLDAARQTRVRQRLAAALGELVARIHDAGIVHDDLHGDNLLVRLEGEDQPRLYVIDLHGVRLGAPLDWRASLANLVVLNRWFVMRASRADRLRFWRAYGEARAASAKVDRPHRATLHEWARELERRTWASNVAFWRGRDSRCLETNRYYFGFQMAGVTGHAVRDLPQEELARLTADPDAPFAQPGVKLLKDSRSSTVAELQLRINGEWRPVIYKRFRLRSWTDPWAALFRPTAALRCWVFGHGLRGRWLPTARPLAVFHRRRHGLSCEGYLLTEKVPDAVDLFTHVAGLAGQPAAARMPSLRGRIDQVAGLVQELHRRQISHRDLKAVNLLVAGEAVWFIDLVGLQRHEHLPRHRRVQNLARLNASFHDSPVLTRTDRLRFLRKYLQWGLRGRADWKRWWREIARMTQAKVQRNRLSGRPLA